MPCFSSGSGPEGQGQTAWRHTGRGCRFTRIRDGRWRDLGEDVFEALQPKGTRSSFREVRGTGKGAEFIRLETDVAGCRSSDAASGFSAPSVEKTGAHGHPLFGFVRRCLRVATLSLATASRLAPFAMLRALAPQRDALLSLRSSS